MVTRKSGSQTPYDRFEGIKRHVNDLEKDNILNGVNYMENFGIGVAKQPAKIKGRILDAPTGRIIRI